MAIEFFTGFEGCGVIEDALALFDDGNTNYITFSDTGGYADSKGITSTGHARHVQKTITGRKTVVAGMHVITATSFYSTIANNLDYVMMTFIGSSINLVNYAVNDLRVYRGSTMIASGIDHIPSGVQHVEVEVFSDTSIGTVKIKLNGAIIADLTGLNTGGEDITGVAWGSQSKVLDNMYIADEFQGEIHSVLLKPLSDVAVNFTPSTGTDNYAMVDDAGQDGDTTYVQSSTVGDQDLYGYEDLDTNLVPIAVTLVTIARKDGTGIRSLQPRIKQDTTEYDAGDEKTLSTTYPNNESNPAILTTLSACPDATAWTRTKLNAMQFGFKVSA